MSNKTLYAILAVSLAAILVGPVFADVFIPPGPIYNQSEWTSPTLVVLNAATNTPIGWSYTDGPTYNGYTGAYCRGNCESDPVIVGPTELAYGSQVTILGFIPGVSVSVDQVPPPVTLQITWNGVPNTITLNTTNIVGPSYPPMVYPNIPTVYEFAYPTSANAADYNLWVGNVATIIGLLGPSAVLPFGTPSANENGEWFWYTFTPNVGDYVSCNTPYSQGMTLSPPTYDITAMFEYGTTQIWFNHVAFDVNLLQVSNDISYCTAQTLNDEIIIYNNGVVPATGLDLTMTFPSTTTGVSDIPQFSQATAEILDPLGNVVWQEGLWTVTQSLPGFSAVFNPSTYNFVAPFDTLAPGDTLTINLPIMISDASNDGLGSMGTFVFESAVSAAQIPAWKDPIAYSIVYWPEGVSTADWGFAGYLFQGYVLTISPPCFSVQCDWPVYVPSVGFLARNYIIIPPMVMALDPSPLPLIAGETSVTLADVALVRNMVLGLAPYNPRADTNGNGIIDVQDLANYEAAAAK